jgi:hypothetical protein
MAKTELRYTLISDGSSDRALIPLLTWSLRQCGFLGAVQPEFADLRILKKKPQGLPERLRASIDLYPCDLLFVHRDCETESVEKRQAEIDEAANEAFKKGNRPEYIRVVPRRMTEAWLLIDEVSIRKAAGNPASKVQLGMPRPQKIEDIADPKACLYDLLRTASEASGRRLHGLKVHRLVHRVAELITDFSPLEYLPAYTEFLAALSEFVERLSQ